ncbi:winged helix-turn-helix domain-containing protein [Streptomyces sp. NPDC001288]|uniref:winged helix-turn-helix domain-containing protein n=1 Tax=Streptomyces sp. NPDC001297 TaxID=3364559 RepID=UPI0036BBFDA0
MVAADAEAARTVVPGVKRAGHDMEHVPDGAAAPDRVLNDRTGLVVLDPGPEAGADDCITEPSGPRELGPRALAVRLGLGDLTHSVVEDGGDLPLTLREFDLLARFVHNPCRTYGREDLPRAVRGWEHGDPSTVTVDVRRLRSKIEDDPARPRRIRSVWRAGYRLDRLGVSEV